MVHSDQGKISPTSVCTKIAAPLTFELEYMADSDSNIALLILVAMGLPFCMCCNGHC